MPHALGAKGGKYIPIILPRNNRSHYFKAVLWDVRVAVSCLQDEECVWCMCGGPTMLGVKNARSIRNKGPLLADIVTA